MTPQGRPVAKTRDISAGSMTQLLRHDVPGKVEGGAWREQLQLRARSPSAAPDLDDGNKRPP